MPPYYVSPPGDQSQVTLLVGVDRSGAVNVLLDHMERGAAEGQVLAQGDTLTLALAYTKWDEAGGHPYLGDCELVRYAFPPP